jgi:hypothetical protein
MASLSAQEIIGACLIARFCCKEDTYQRNVIFAHELELDLKTEVPLNY